MKKLQSQIPSDWKEVLKGEDRLGYFAQLERQVRKAYLSGVVYPPQEQIFNAFALCPYKKTKVVILGQDPYHGVGQAHGLAFSVCRGIPLPPSLRNIFKEVIADIKAPVPQDGNLERWASQGVLLLNSILTVGPGLPSSHKNFGWERFTDSVIQKISHNNSQVVFMLWGNYAASKRPLIDESKHLVLTAPHPSPLSAHRGFLGCRHFSHANSYLRYHGKTAITW